jgi:hypothetical protein
MVTCTFTNARRGALIVATEVSPEGAAGDILFTGVPSGTVSANGTLVVTDLTPGTYTTTAFDDESGLELTDVTCDDGASPTASSGDAVTRTAVYNLDAGETVQCLFSFEAPESETGAGGSADGGADGAPEGGINPFDNPDEALSDFPLPDELPPDAGSYGVPKAGPWTVTNLAGQMDCGVTSLGIPASPPETGVIEVLDDGQTLVGTSLQDDQAGPVTMSADPQIVGRYTGAAEGMEEGVPITIDYIWQVVTDEFIVGYLTSTFSAEGVTCSIYRPYELVYTGQE